VSRLSTVQPEISITARKQTGAIDPSRIIVRWYFNPRAVDHGETAN